MVHRLTVLITLLTIVLCGPFALLADDDSAADPEAIEQLFAEYAKPGLQHQLLGLLAGEWDVEVKTFMPDPENPEVSAGTASYEVLMGGRYVRQNFESEIHGENFHGMQIKGFDNALQKYVGSWIDNMGTGIMRSTGTVSAETGIMTETGESSSPLGTISYRMITVPENANAFSFTMHMTMPGAPEQKVMELHYTRKE